MFHSPSSLDDKKVSSKDTKHFAVALARRNVDRADGALCFESYGVSVIVAGDTCLLQAKKNEKVTVT